MTQNLDVADEDWVRAAMVDDSAVAELLIRFRHPPTKRCSPSSPPTLPLEWSVRQRRSQTMKEKQTPPSASPTTPLSWSGATSVSGGAGDGFEKSSRQPPEKKDCARSKVNVATGINTNKRSRKKKTLGELKEEETLLVKERRILKKQLAALRVTLDEQRDMNESLKRYKATIRAMPNQMQENAFFAQQSPSISGDDIRDDDHEAVRPPPPLRSSSENLVLPDLNLPLEEQPNMEVSRI